MGSRVRLLALLVCAPLAMPLLPSGSAAAADVEGQPPDINEAQRLVFMNEGLRDLSAGSVIRYDFNRKGSAVEAFSDTVTLKVTAVQDDSRRDLEFDFLTGPNHIDFHGAKGYAGNPVIIQYLERDIRDMAERTGGNIGYFRNRLRRSFAHPQVTPVKVDVHGQPVEGVEVRVTPFTDDPNLERFPMYGKKTYQFVFADAVPGGLYQIHAQVPDPSGGDILIDEQMTFRDLSREG